MRRFIIALAALTVLGPIATAHATVRIFACEPEWAALAQVIGGDNVKVTPATSGRQDPHHIRAKPSLLAAMRRANLVVCTGAGLEAGWLPVLMRQAAPASVQMGQPGNLMVTNYLHLMEIPATIDRSMGDVHASGNPHVQTDPRNILVAAKVLADRLAHIDPANMVAYHKNLDDFRGRWQADMERWAAEAAKLKGIPTVVYHDNWVYMNHWLGLNEIITLEVKPGVPPTPSHLQQVLAAAKAAKVKMIVLAPFDNDDAAKWLSKQIGAKIVRLPFTVGGVKGADTLEKMFDVTLTRLVEAAP